MASLGPEIPAKVALVYSELSERLGQPPRPMDCRTPVAGRHTAVAVPAEKAVAMVQVQDPRS